MQKAQNVFVHMKRDNINGNVGKPHTEGKNLINDNIIEQVTD